MKQLRKQRKTGRHGIYVLILLTLCAPVMAQHEFEATNEVDREGYSAEAAGKGVVLVSTSGGRAWNCGSYENAELRSVGFDLEPSTRAEGSAPDLVINSVPDGHKNYAFLLQPGTYALSYISIKVARSMSDVGYMNTNRSTLLSGPDSAGGSFTVAAGEVVYIGHFALDCAYGPTLWRFYLEDREAFEGYLSQYSEAYPYLNLDNARYRLFTTSQFGQDYALP